MGDTDNSINNTAATSTGLQKPCHACYRQCSSWWQECCWYSQTTCVTSRLAPPTSMTCARLISQGGDSTPSRNPAKNLSTEGVGPTEIILIPKRNVRTNAEEIVQEIKRKCK